MAAISDAFRTLSQILNSSMKPVMDCERGGVGGGPCRADRRCPGAARGVICSMLPPVWGNVDGSWLVRRKKVAPSLGPAVAAWQGRFRRAGGAAHDHA